MSIWIDSVISQNVNISSQEKEILALVSQANQTIRLTSEPQEDIARIREARIQSSWVVSRKYMYKKRYILSYKIHLSQLIFATDFAVQV